VAGWEPLLEEVARERYPRLVAYGMLLTGSQADAGDLVQEVLMATFVGGRRFDGIGQAEQYVRRAIVSKFIDRYRMLDRERELWHRASHESHPVVGDHGPSVGAMTDMGAELRTLPPRQRAARGPGTFAGPPRSWPTPLDRREAIAMRR